ncbi:MAG: MgtC/SapB family protein [Bacillota bacterium]|nr:MgtC/SapB family protein [Bacillota bacterium]
MSLGEMSITYNDIVLRLLAATLIGFVLGLERKHSAKPVGARTHILVCLSACVVAMISAYGFVGVPQFNPNADPARLVVGVLTGIGFIGAGIIWKAPAGNVHGITTAAAIFLLAALGIACGLGLFFLAGITALIAFITLVTNDWVKHYQNYKLRKQTAAKMEEYGLDKPKPQKERAYRRINDPKKHSDQP